MTTEDVIIQDLQGRISRIKGLVEEAEGCLVNGEFLQTAVRLQCLADENCKFESLLLQVLDSLDQR